MAGKKAQRQREVSATPAHDRGMRQTTLLAITAVAGVIIGMALFNARQQNWFGGTMPASVVTPTGGGSDRDALPNSETESEAELESAVPAAPVDLQILKGQWLRNDGGYVIEVKSMDANGKADVAYLNPKPIHVEKAEAWLDDAGAARISIKLQDVNYPGSTYDLKYDSRRDRLGGLYYQAVEKQHFDVVFQRKP